MSDVNQNEAAPVAPVTAPVATPAPATTPAPAKKNAIQLVEEQIASFIKQREEAIAKVHAIEGAIQASQHLLSVFRTEAAKAEAEAKAFVEKMAADAKATVEKVKTEAETLVVEAEKKL